MKFSRILLYPHGKIIFFSDKRSPGKVYSRWYFSTILHPVFCSYGNNFYNKKVKVVPRSASQIHKWLQPRSIAYWYMDDGAQKWAGKSLGVRFCTDSLSIGQVRSLIKFLENKYLLKCTIQKKDGKPRIYVSSYSYVVLRDLIFHFIITSMHYKFPKVFLPEKTSKTSRST